MAPITSDPAVLDHAPVQLHLVGGGGAEHVVVECLQPRQLLLLRPVPTRGVSRTR